MTTKPSAAGRPQHTAEPAEAAVAARCNDRGWVSTPSAESRLHANCSMRTTRARGTRRLDACEC